MFRTNSQPLSGFVDVICATKAMHACHLLYVAEPGLVYRACRPDVKERKKANMFETTTIQYRTVVCPNHFYIKACI